MENVRRFLKGNAGSEAPASFVFFDTETFVSDPDHPTLPKVNRLRLWCATYVRIEKGEVRTREEATGTTPESFHEFVRRHEDRCRPLWCYAHNLGFDLSILKYWDYLESGHYTIGPMVRPQVNGRRKPKKPWKGRLAVEGAPTFAVVHGERGIIKFVDTFNYWPVKLEDLGAAQGVPKAEMPAWDAPDIDWIAYCKQDVRVIEETVLGAVKAWCRERCGVWKMTAAGLAFTNWRHTVRHRAKDGERVNLVLESQSPARPMEREGYYGGRVEPFFVGKAPEPLTAVDVASLYPYVMMTNYYPFRRLEHLRRPKPATLRNLCKVYGSVARVRVRGLIDTHICRANGVQCHAVGDFWTTLCGPELKRALDAGQVHAIEEAHTYAMADLFSDWVTRWYDKKRKAEKAGERGRADLALSKLILNSLSGKFAQRGNKWVDRPELGREREYHTWFQCEPGSSKLKQFRSVAGVIQSKEVDNEPIEAFPIISAFITSYGREFMRAVIKAMPAKSVYYIATDGLLVNDAAIEQMQRLELIGDGEIGKFRVKNRETECEIKGPNNYRFGPSIVRSGQWARAKLVPGVGWVANIWQGLSSILSQRPDGTVRVQPVVLKKESPTAKGHRTPDGWVTPFVLTADPRLSDRPALRSVADRDPTPVPQPAGH